MASYLRLPFKKEIGGKCPSLEGPRMDVILESAYGSKHNEKGGAMWLHCYICMVNFDAWRIGIGIKSLPAFPHGHVQCIKDNSGTRRGSNSRTPAKAPRLVTSATQIPLYGYGGCDVCRGCNG